MKNGDELPGVEAVVVSLGGDFAVAKFEKHGRVAAHLGTGRQSAKGDRQGARPQDLERDAIFRGGLAGNFIRLTSENLSALFEGFGYPGGACPQTIRINTIGELLDDGIWRKQRRNIGGIAVFDGFQILTGLIEYVRHGTNFLPQRTRRNVDPTSQQLQLSGIGWLNRAIEY